MSTALSQTNCTLSGSFTQMYTTEPSTGCQINTGLLRHLLF